MYPACCNLIFTLGGVIPPFDKLGVNGEVSFDCFALRVNGKSRVI
jgi:hypothetical protein